MRVGRQTSDPKTAVVKLRLNEEMKAHLERKSKMHGVNVSEYIRQLIKKDM